MIASKAVRAARKKAQLDRLKKKGDEDYPQFYASQPQQHAKKQVNQQIREDRKEVRRTAEVLQIAEITGDGLLAAQEKAAVAVLVLEKHLAAKQLNPKMVLTAVGGN